MGKVTAKKVGSKKGSVELHQLIVKKALVKMSTKHSMVWANNTGMVVTEDDRVVKFGLKGSSDILGIYKGLFLGIEVKTGNATQSKFQKNFEKRICELGGIYVLIKDSNVEQILTIVEQKYQEISR